MISSPSMHSWKQQIPTGSSVVVEVVLVVGSSVVVVGQAQQVKRRSPLFPKVHGGTGSEQSQGGSWSKILTHVPLWHS
jgi:hypothetical protein